MASGENGALSTYSSNNAASTRTYTKRRGKTMSICCGPCAHTDHAPDRDLTGDEVSRPSPSSPQTRSPLNQASLTVPITNSSQTRNNGGKLLAQEIEDEFLKCKICLDVYKSPKCLTCLHTFCEDCIESHIISETTYKKFSDYRDFTCPLCRKRTQLPLGGVRKLPDNFLLSSLAEMLARRQQSEASSRKFLQCDICKTTGLSSSLVVASSDLVVGQRRSSNSNGAFAVAKHRCLECNKHLCADCVRLHGETRVTKSHSIIDVQIAAEVICKEHEDEVVHFYCEPCQTCICVLCTFHEHRNHEICCFTEAIAQHKNDLVALLTQCKARIGLYEENIDQVLQAEHVIREAQQKIKDYAKGFVDEIRQQENVLLQEVEQVYGPQALEALQQCSEWQSQLEALCSTCSMTEVVLQGKDVELLLLKKDLQEKLHSLSKAADQLTLPANIRRRLAFVPGHVELGFLDVADSRSETRKSAYKLVTEQRTFGSQTDDNEIQLQMIPEKLSSIGISVQTEISTTCQRGVGTDSVLMVDRGVSTRSRGSLHNLQSGIHQEVATTGSSSQESSPYFSPSREGSFGLEELE